MKIWEVVIVGIGVLLAMPFLMGIIDVWWWFFFSSSLSSIPWEMGRIIISMIMLMGAMFVWGSLI
jgi:hypothetical protein